MLGGSGRTWNEFFERFVSVYFFHTVSVNTELRLAIVLKPTDGFA